MNTPIKTLSVLAAFASIAVATDAGVQRSNARPDRRPEGFNCPVCGSPCISRTEIQQHRRQRLQAFREGQSRPNQPANARRRQRIEHRTPQQQVSPEPARPREQRQLRFDIDRDGQLSPAERAARRAYAQAKRIETGDIPRERSAPPPIEE